MKTTFKAVALVLLAILVGGIIGVTIIGSIKVSEIKKQNQLLERHIQAVADQNELLCENKMCLAFDQGRQDRGPITPPPQGQPMQ